MRSWLWGLLVSWRGKESPDLFSRQNPHHVSKNIPEVGENVGKRMVSIVLVFIDIFSLTIAGLGSEKQYGDAE